MRLLVISNLPLSMHTSAGRTILNMLDGFSSEEITNVFLHGAPDYDRATFYRFSDKDALKSLFPLTPNMPKPVGNIDEKGETKKSKKKKKKTAGLALAREIVWQNPRIKRGFLRFVKRLNPQIILVVMGDSGFLLQLSAYLSGKTNTPLLTFNSEDYYFKDYDYFCQSLKKTFIFETFIKRFRRNVDLLYKTSSHDIFLTEDLRRLYSGILTKEKTTVIYTSSSLVEKGPTHKGTNSKSFSYLGSIGNGRLRPLIELANAIERVDPSFSLDVYTETERDLIQEKLPNNMRVLPFVPYQKAIEIMGDSYAVVHVDGMDTFNREFTKRGFSTKIADCLAIGNCFIAISPKENTVYKYLKENECAYVVSDLSELFPLVQRIINNPLAREKYINSALKISKKNHSSKKNSRVFSLLAQGIVEQNANQGCHQK